MSLSISSMTPQKVLSMCDCLCRLTIAKQTFVEVLPGYVPQVNDYLIFFVDFEVVMHAISKITKVFDKHTDGPSKLVVIAVFIFDEFPVRPYISGLSGIMLFGSRVKANSIVIDELFNDEAHSRFHVLVFGHVPP